MTYFGGTFQSRKEPRETRFLSSLPLGEVFSVPRLFPFLEDRFFTPLLSVSGSYFCFDNPGALQDNFKTDLQMSTSKFVLLYSIYSWPNVILCFIGGFLLDSVFGVRLGTIIYMGLTLIGQLIFATGAMVNAFWLMMIGRFVFGYVHDLTDWTAETPEVTTEGIRYAVSFVRQNRRRIVGGRPKQLRRTLVQGKGIEHGIWIAIELRSCRIHRQLLGNGTDLQLRVQVLRGPGMYRRSSISCRCHLRGLYDMRLHLGSNGQTCRKIAKARRRAGTGSS